MIQHHDLTENTIPNPADIGNVPEVQTLLAPPDIDGALNPEGVALAPASTTAKIASLVAIILPFLGLIAAIVMLWGPGVSWIHLVLLGVGYVLTALGITVGYHRLFTHKSFETGPVLTALFGILGSMAVQGPVLDWVAQHRRHHQHSDREDDPHSPHLHGRSIKGVLRGIFHSHMGWFFTPNPVDMRRYVKDLEKDRVVRVVSKLFPLWVALSGIIPGAIAWAVTGSWVGGVLGVVWGGLVRLFLVHHVTWSINSACHLWGAKPFRSHDESRNNVIFGILAMGEGWHNNHHAFPASARHGLFWWQFDLSWILIKALEKVGLVWNVRVPAPERIASKRR